MTLPNVPQYLSIFDQAWETNGLAPQAESLANLCQSVKASTQSGIMLQQYSHFGDTIQLKAHPQGDFLPE